MVSHLGRAALLALVVIVLGSSLATIPGASAASPNYAITGYVYPVGSSRDYANVQVDLISQATGAVYTTLTNSGGQFSFTSASTSSALQPGYWGLSVPVQTNVTTITSRIGPCAVCAVLPSNQTPSFSFYTASNLTTTPPTPILYATILSYTVKVSGTVDLSGSALPDAPVQLLAPFYNGAVLYNTTSNATTGAYTLKAPPGSWVVQATDPNPPGYVGTTNVTATGTVVTVNPNIQSYVVKGQMFNSKGVPVGTPGNATLFDPSTGYIYSTPTDVSGRYTLGTYGADFGSGSNTFDLFLSSEGYGTIEHTFTTNGPTNPITFNAVLPRLTSSQRGLYNTTLDFSKFNNATGTGNLTVNTTAALGNYTIVQNLPNATVGQLWAQLGLDFNSSTSIPATLLSAFYSWVNSSGPFFPAVQAGTTINGTAFVPPTSTQPLASATTSCSSGYCGPGTSSNLTLTWSNTYALNGSVYRNSSTYSIGLGFRHPTSSSDIYNYTVILPTGYVLKAGTPVPSDARLVPLGPDGTWSKFTLESLYDTSPAAALNFTIISATTIFAIVNATIPTYFAFSEKNVLNSTNGNYTVEVGLGQNVTFSALNTIYPSGINGTKFLWNFGDGTYSNVTTGSTYHIYAKGTTGNTPDKGSLKVIGSNRYNDTTKFYVYVATGPATAGIVSNASASQNQTVGGTPYLFINWGTVLHFNATGSKASVSPGTTNVSGVLSVASFSLVSKGFSQSANYSESSGAYFGSNYTYQFLGAGSYLTNGTVAGHLVPFKGWQYNLTLKIWTGTGQTATTTLVILVNDTEKPIASFVILNSAGTPISGKSVVALSNLSAQIQLNAANSTDPHNGSVVRYYWLIGQVGNGSFHIGTNVTTVKPYPKFWLTASTSNYWVNLTVFDRNNNPGHTNQTLTVAANTTTTPILAATNLTGPSKLNEGSSYTFWVNVTVGGGTKSSALGIRVAWYVTSPGGTSRRYIASTVTFFNYTASGIVNTVAMATGSVGSYPYNNVTWKSTLRAVITWTPPITGNYILYANATANNEFSGDYSSATNVASMSITINPNPTTQTLEYVAVGVAAVVVVLGIVLWARRRSGGGKAPKSTSKSGLERGSKRAADEDEEEEET